MKTVNSISMQDHPAKAVVSFFFGLFAGTRTLIEAPFLQTHWQEFITFSIACVKAFTIGGFAWAGQTAVAWGRRSVVKAWRNRKIVNK